MKTTDALLILVRNPNSYSDQTPRLRVFSDSRMAALYAAFVEDVIGAAAMLEDVDIKVAVAPRDRTKMITRAVDNLQEQYARRKTFQSLGERVEILAQRVGSMSNRLQDALDYCFDNGYSRVLSVGGYNPTLTFRRLAQALRQLKKHQAVIGPTFRGGCYLIGVSQNDPQLLEDLPIATDDTYAAICNRMQELEYKWCELDLWYDVTHQEDLEFIIRDINHFRMTDDEDSARATEEVFAKFIEMELEPEGTEKQ